VAVQRPSPSVLTATVGTRETESVLVLPQNFNGGWSATTTQGSLTPVRINGWQQGFIVAPGARTTVVAEFAPNRLYQFGLYLGAIALLVVLLGAFRASRRGARGPAGGRWIQSPILATAIAVIGGGPPALFAAVAAMVIAKAWSRVEWVVVGSLLAAGVIVALRPFPIHLTSFESPLVQVLVWLSVLTTLWCGRWPRRTRARRMIGRSTK
jgi:arabinofuranan 3-O-arabinosyltransferase